MNSRRALSEVDPSAAILLWQVDPQDMTDEVAVWHEHGLTVRTVRGRKMRTVDALFNETAAALQFPDYFGENWPAFDECLSDMEWLSTDVGIVIRVVDPGDVLADDHEAELGALVRTFVRAATAYAEPIALGEWWDRPALAFHVVVAVTPGEAEPVRSRWEAAGAAVSELAP